MTPERWLESVETAEGMMREAGVIMTLLDEPLDVTMRFGGEVIDV